MDISKAEFLARVAAFAAANPKAQMLLDHNHGFDGLPAHPETIPARFFIVNAQWRALSGYYPNALAGGQLCFSTKSAYTFRTTTEAAEFIQHIRATCAPGTRAAASQLTVSAYARGWQ